MIDLRALCLLLIVVSSQALADPLALDRTTERSSTIATSQGKAAIAEAKRWGLSEKEWSTYQEIMLGQGRYFWRDTDPITVLGIYAETGAERERYAEMLAIQEYELQKRFLALNDAYLVAARRLVGDEPVLDMAKFDRYYNTSPASYGRSGGRTKDSVFGRDIGSRIVLFVSSDCTGCTDYYERVRQRQSFGVGLDIYFVDTTEQQIIAWAKARGIDPALVRQGTVTLNRDDGNYARYGKPALPTAYYYDAESNAVSVLGEEGGP